jgi:hypothetical protein
VNTDHDILYANDQSFPCWTNDINTAVDSASCQASSTANSLVAVIHKLRLDKERQMSTVLSRSLRVILAVVMTLGSLVSVDAISASNVKALAPELISDNPSGDTIPSRATRYYLADRVIQNTDFAKLANWGVNTAIVDFDVNGSALEWRAVFASAAAANINVVIWPSDWNDPRPHCGWEAPYPVSASGDITKVKNLLDVASQYPNFIGIVNAHESFWTCDMSFDEMAGLKEKLKAYALSKGRAIKVWNYIDNLYNRSMLPDNQIERILDVAVTWQHCAGNVEGTCNTESPNSALNMIRNDRKRIADSGAKVELVFIMQTFTTGGYSTKFTLSQLQDYSCEFLNTSALDGFGFYTWHAGWWSDLHSWTELQPAVPYVYNHCTAGLRDPLSISGSIGVAGVTLSYLDGSPKTVTSLANGKYSMAVPDHWSGVVTPSHPCFTFSPTSLSYTDVTTHQSGQNYTPAFNPAAECGDIDVSVGGIQQGRFGLPVGASTRSHFAGVSNGPVKIASNNGVSLIAAERVVYKVNGIFTSFSEMMGLPDHQLDTVYWLPWYNNAYAELDTQLRFANGSGSPATVHVYIGGQEMQGSPFTLLAGESIRQSFTDINNGPVMIESDIPIVAAERVIYASNGINTSFSEMMALPNSQLDTVYWLPWYNNVELDTQLRFANVSDTPAAVHVYIGGAEMVGSPFTLEPGASTRQNFAGTNNGPVKIESNVPIVAAERVIYEVDGVNTSFTEMMALPNSQLDTVYWLPWYNNAHAELDTQLRFANVSSTSATVHVYIGGVEMMGSPFTLKPDESTRRSFAGVNNGPVQIVSNARIVVAERVVHKINNIRVSFSEMIGLPNSQLDTVYWLPWYNNASAELDTQLRFGVP